MDFSRTVEDNSNKISKVSNNSKVDNNNRDNSSRVNSSRDSSNRRKEEACLIRGIMLQNQLEGCLEIQQEGLDRVRRQILEPEVSIRQRSILIRIALTALEARAVLLVYRKRM